MDEDTPDPPSTIAPELRAAWRFSILQQVIIYAGVFFLTRDVRFIYAAVIAHAVYWAGIAFIIFLRRSKPILLDLLFARWGYPLLWLLTMVILLQITKAHVY
jgi:hypothetical protein